MTGKRIFGMLAAIALLSVSATGAEAGAGGSPSPLTSFFLCKGINGDNADMRVDVDSFDSGPTNAGWAQTLQNARIGVATLACRFARLYLADGTPHTPCAPGVTTCNEIDPQPLVGPEGNQTPLNGEDLKCYAVSAAKGQIQGATGGPLPNPPTSYTVTDGLLGEDLNVTESSVQYVCAPARFSPNF